MVIKVALLLGFAVLLVLLAVRRLRHYRLKERYTLLFFACAMPFLALAIWPGAVGWLAKILDIQYFTLALMCVCGFFILMIFELLTIVSIQDRRINTLAQIVGMMMEKHGMSDREMHDRSTSSEPLSTVRRVTTDSPRLPGESERAAADNPYEKVR